MEINELNKFMKDVVGKMKEKGKSDDEIARAELIIQYVGNDDFRKKLQNYVFLMTYNPPGK